MPPNFQRVSSLIISDKCTIGHLLLFRTSWDSHFSSGVFSMYSGKNIRFTRILEYFENKVEMSWFVCFDIWDGLRRNKLTVSPGFIIAADSMAQACLQFIFASASLEQDVSKKNIFLEEVSSFSPGVRQGRNSMLIIYLIIKLLKYWICY